MPTVRSSVSGAKAEPEDIFSGVEQPKKAPVRSPMAAAPIGSSSSGLKYVWIALGVFLIVGIGGFLFWYFAIQKPAPQEATAPVPTEATTTPPAEVPPPTDTAPVLEVPTTSVPVPFDTSSATEAVSSTGEALPVTEPPLGTSIPLPQSITTTSSPVAPTPVPSVDTDHDGLSDQREAELGTDPLKPDTDGDGLSDGDEVNKYGTNPLNPDTDGDTYPDGVEVRNGFNPRGSGPCLKKGCVL